MPIRIEHGRPETVIAAARRAGEAQAALREAERAGALEVQREEFEYKRALRQQDMMIDLQMQERAKLWEIEKMEMASRVDFMRKERERERKIDSAESALHQLDKEIEAGRLDPNEMSVQNMITYYQMKKATAGEDVPIGLVRQPREAVQRITPSQQLAAYRALQAEELQEPVWHEKLRPTWLGGRAELTEEERAYREIFERIAKGTIAPVAPQVPEDAFKIGQEIERGGRRYKIVGFDVDGMPLVEPM